MYFRWLNLQSYHNSEDFTLISFMSLKFHESPFASPIDKECDAASSFRCQIVQRRNVKKRSEGGRSYNCREIEHSVAPRRSINPPRLLKRRTPTLSIVGNDRQFLNTSSQRDECRLFLSTIFVSWDSFLGKYHSFPTVSFLYEILSWFTDYQSIVAAGISSSNNALMHCSNWSPIMSLLIICQINSLFINLLNNY